MTELQSINGHQLLVERHGAEDGEPVVLLHHGLGSVFSWKNQVPALVEAGYYVVAYDRWGYGGSTSREQLSMPYFKEDLADLETLLDVLGLSQVSLLGHSDGGNIALSLAAAHPQRVRCLVIVAAHIYVEPSMELGINRVRRAFESDPRFREGLRRLHHDNTQSVFDGWYGGWRRSENLGWDMRPVLKDVKCPTLVVQGMEDEHATPQHARDLAAAVPGAELWLVAGASHMLPQEQPELFNRKLVEFLDRCTKTQSSGVSEAGI